MYVNGMSKRCASIAVDILHEEMPDIKVAGT